MLTTCDQQGAQLLSGTQPFCVKGQQLVSWRETGQLRRATAIHLADRQLAFFKGRLQSAVGELGGICGEIQAHSF